MGRKAFTDRKCHSLSAQRGCHSQNKSPPRPPAPRAISIQPGPPPPAGLLGSRITHSTAFDGKVGRQRDPGGALGETGKQGLEFQAAGDKGLIENQMLNWKGGAANPRRRLWSWAGSASRAAARGRTVRFWISKVEMGSQYTSRDRRGRSADTVPTRADVRSRVAATQGLCQQRGWGG